jgi:excisionase family DNA binding protein
MAGRGRSAGAVAAAPRPKRTKRKRLGGSASSANGEVATEPLVYTAQDVARFCEVDLKTIHHWADAGKIAHHRTDGRHLRFRRNHVVEFLRTHGYPLHPQITTARPTVFVATKDVPDSSLATHFIVHRFETAIVAIAHLVSGEPDALIVSMQDTSIARTACFAALKANAATSWVLLVVTGDDRESEVANADITMQTSNIAELEATLATRLAIEIE